MVSEQEVIRVVADVLQIGDRSTGMTVETPLLGAMPEFDSMAVVSIITAMEEEFGLVVDDDDITGEVFETIGTLHDFVNQHA
ncbi:acyl carrier protein [Chromatocurvus halotolerans]|uniref:Phosphopantetheine binding protein n=1 Tax=Chromatocurvus halotolerans TaxID=1132028 RepID=A0A4R2KTA7_9GAMM|nr:acyl carrier protein [Chromatocurvus halotolerans]TCO74299.1 phosphopantetheine binding protein [Chromatocurvus halotolerans]